jgi:biopolymer transport protein ExbB
MNLNRVLRWMSFFMLLFILLASSSQVSAVWNNQWVYRRKITLSSLGTDVKASHGQAVVLLRLHSGNLDFTRVKEGGADLRFVSSDDKTLLKYHIEKFDSVDEMALVWVQLDGLSGASGENFIWMYYGNKDAEAGDDARGTYDTNQAAVYHFGEAEGLLKDQTANGNNIPEFTGTRGIPAIIGSGVSFNGISDRMVIPDSPSLSFPSGFTFSTWIRIAAAQKDAYLFSRGDGKAGMVVGINQTRLYVRLSEGKENGKETRKETGKGKGKGKGKEKEKEQNSMQTSMIETNTDLSLSAWHQVAVSVDQNRKLAVYLDGTQTFTKDLPEPFPELAGNIVLGASAAGETSAGGSTSAGGGASSGGSTSSGGGISAQNGHFLSGDLDEIEISNLARPDAWIKLNAGSQGPESSICSYGAEEKNISGGKFGRLLNQYLEFTKTTIRVTSLDGWVVNIIIIILLIVSWYVLINKVITLKIVDKENKAFYRAFKEAKDPFSFEDDGQDFQSSSLYNIYRAGRQELDKRFNNPDCYVEKRLSSKGLNAFKAALEKGSTAEEQRLNRQLMILTLGISGGPFLGLFGTVYGIMNTFAAITAAGEADILAIAPGIASAISTTVLGLIVGIPALFSYNYLVAKIKDMTVEMYLLIDELVCNADESYGE